MNLMHRFIAVFVAVLCVAGSQNAQAAAVPVTILTPAGGEFYVAGSRQRVRLDPKTKSKSIAIHLSIDGGVNFTPLGTIDNTTKDKTKRNVLEFTVPNTPSGNCLVRATADALNSLSSGFSIGTAGGSGGVTAAQINSDTAPDGSVLTADGSGGASFSTLDGKFVKIAGDTMTGALTLSGDPASNLHAATKQYVDAENTRATGAEGTLTVALAAEAARATAAEGTLTTNLNAEITRAIAAEATLTTNVGGKVSKAGDTMTGALTVTPSVTIIDPTTATLTLQGGSDKYHQVSDANGWRFQRDTGASISTFMSLTASSGDFSFGSGGRVISRGNGSVQIDGALTYEATTLNNINFTANNATCGFFCNSSTSSITVTLPDPTTTPTGRIYIIKKVSANNTVTITPTNSTIDGAANVVLSANNSYRILMCNGQNWFVIGQ